MKTAAGFTLSELLIALAILGVIATFTIPKVLQSQQDGKFKSMAKEAAGTISTAFQEYQRTNAVSAATQPNQLTPYLNYVKVVSTGSIDGKNGENTQGCGSGNTCLLMHNGGVLRYNDGATFNGTASTNGLWFFFDPDGKVTDGTTNGPGKSVQFWLLYNGRIVTDSNRTFTVTDSMGNWAPCANCDPSWFSWD